MTTWLLLPPLLLFTGALCSAIRVGPSSAAKSKSLSWVIVVLWMEPRCLDPVGSKSDSLSCYGSPRSCLLGQRLHKTNRLLEELLKTHLN